MSLTNRIDHTLIACVALLCSFGTATASSNSTSLRLSVGSSFQTLNDVQIPNNDMGSRYSLQEAVGEGPVTAIRLEIRKLVRGPHGVRVLLAPLSYTETVTFDDPVQFVGGDFPADTATDATYKFNSWRVGYFYSLVHSDIASFRVGATLKVRDAEIRLEQGDNVSFDDDLGLVPLLYVSGSYQFTNSWTVSADLDGLAGGPGRAIDFGLGLDYSLSNRWNLGAEVRILDGGADTDEVYNFAQFGSAALVLSTGF